MTAHYLGHDTHPVAPGDAVLVHAGAGGMGLLLCRMASALGATVITTTSTEEKGELAREAGAHHVLRYEGFADRVRELTDGRGVAVVYDGVGATTFDESLRAFARARGDGALRRGLRAGAAGRSAAPELGWVALPDPSVVGV